MSAFGAAVFLKRRSPWRAGASLREDSRSGSLLFAPLRFGVFAFCSSCGIDVFAAIVSHVLRPDACGRSRRGAVWCHGKIGRAGSRLERGFCAEWNNGVRGGEKTLRRGERGCVGGVSVASVGWIEALRRPVGARGGAITVGSEPG